MRAYRTCLPLPALCLATVLLAAHLLFPLQAAGYDPYKAAAELRAKYAANIAELAKWCEANGLADEARQTRRVLGPTDPYKLYVPVLPEEVGPPLPSPFGRGAGGEGSQESTPSHSTRPHPNPLPTNLRSVPGEGADSEKVSQWKSRLVRLRREQAAALYEMARRAVRGGREGIAFDVAVAAMQADPDYEPVRRLFGYQKFRDQWHTLYEVKKLRAGFVWSDKFGWLPKAHLRRYEDGQRYDNGRWISAADDAQRHRDIRSGWDVETEHYTIRTDHSIEAGVALGMKLEQLYRLWQEMFLRYFASESDVVALFDGRPKPPPPRVPHRIVYFRDRDDYKRSLGASMPNFETSGIYQQGRAYFFADKENDDRTLYHEATHQLFYESRPVVPDVGQRANFWIVEGIAMYMESLRREDGFYVLGGFSDLRMHAAQYRLLNDRFYVPLAEFTAYGRKQLQADPRIATLYSQAAGLANFLVYYHGGRYRDALVAYLVAVYTGRDGPDTLAKLTGVDYSTLDKQYREFMEGGK